MARWRPCQWSNWLLRRNCCGAGSVDWDVPWILRRVARGLWNGSSALRKFYGWTGGSGHFTMDEFPIFHLHCSTAIGWIPVVKDLGAGARSIGHDCIENVVPVNFEPT